METHCRMKSPIQAELASGTSVRASETALTMKSLTESLTAPALPAPLKSSRSFMSLSVRRRGERISLEDEAENGHSTRTDPC